VPAARVHAHTTRSYARSSQYNPIWDFKFNIPEAGPCEMQFSSVTGHLMSMDFSGAMKKWHGCDPLELYSAEIIKSVPQVLLGVKAL
jgi:DNA topoisomerase-3